MEVPEHPWEEGSGAETPLFSAEVSEEFFQSRSSMGSLAPLATAEAVSTANLSSMFTEPAVPAEPKIIGWDDFFRYSR